MDLSENSAVSKALPVGFKIGVLVADIYTVSTKVSSAIVRVVEAFVSLLLLVLSCQDPDKAWD